MICFTSQLGLIIDPSLNSYEQEIRGLRQELDARGVQTVSSHMAGAPIHAGPSHAPPPALGHGPSNLFGGIMANQGGGGPGLAPPPPQPHDQQQPPQHSLQQPAPGAQQPQGPPQPQPGTFGGYQPGAAVNGTYTPLTRSCKDNAHMLTLTFVNHRLRSTSTPTNSFSRTREGTRK